MRPDRGPRGAGLPAQAVVLLAALLLAACSSAPQPRPAMQPTTGLHAQRFRALGSALEEGEEALARRLIDDLRTRDLAPNEAAWVDSCERVLVGRLLVRGLHLALESEPVPDEPGRRRLFLVARSDAGADVRLRLPPADLKRLRASMDARGVEGMQYESSACHALEDLVLPPTVPRRVELLTYELPLGRALAVRERWRLDARSGEIEHGGESYPAADLRVADCEQERLSPLLPVEAVEPEALAVALAAEPAPSRRELLELALRIPFDRRPEALAALAPEVARLAALEPERVQRAEPALRWLTHNRDLGPDALAWSRYLSGAAAPRERSGPPADGLDLPDHDQEAR